MNTQLAHQLQAEGPEPRSVPEQLQLNRMAVDRAANETLAQATHPARWERRGLLGRLVRRDPG
jgi:hypothetical protein